MEKVKDHMLTMCTIICLIVVLSIFGWLISNYGQIMVIGLIVIALGYLVYETYSGILEEIRDHRKEKLNAKQVPRVQPES